MIYEKSKSVDVTKIVKSVVVTDVEDGGQIVADLRDHVDYKRLKHVQQAVYYQSSYNAQFLVMPGFLSHIYYLFTDKVSNIHLGTELMKKNLLFELFYQKNEEQ